MQERPIHHDEPPSSKNGDGDWHVGYQVDGEWMIDPTPMSEQTASEAASQIEGGVILKETVEFD